MPDEVVQVGIADVVEPSRGQIRPTVVDSLTQGRKFGGVLSLLPLEKAETFRSTSLAF